MVVGGYTEVQINQSEHPDTVILSFTYFHKSNKQNDYDNGSSYRYPSIEIAQHEYPASRTCGAVFASGINGIVKTTLKQFAKHTRQPRIYYVGRVHDAANRIKCDTWL